MSQFIVEIKKRTENELEEHSTIAQSIPTFWTLGIHFSSGKTTIYKEHRFINRIFSLSRPTSVAGCQRRATFTFVCTCKNVLAHSRFRRASRELWLNFFRRIHKTLLSCKSFATVGRRRRIKLVRSSPWKISSSELDRRAMSIDRTAFVRVP